MYTNLANLEIQFEIRLTHQVCRIAHGYMLKKDKNVDIRNEWWIYWWYVKIKQMAIHLSYTVLFICEEDDIKILRNQDLGYNCGKQNYFVILWKTTKKLCITEYY